MCVCVCNIHTSEGARVLAAYAVCYRIRFVLLTAA